MAAHGGVRVGRVLLLVFGGLATLIALALLASGGVLAWAYAKDRDADGYFTTSTERLHTPTYALSSEKVDLGAEPGSGDWLVRSGAIDAVRLRASSVGGTPIFVGIGRERAVARYLADVPHDVIVRADLSGPDLGVASVRYRRDPGTRAPAPPAAQRFWAASTSGPGQQTLNWKPRSGEWTAVVLNVTPRRGVVVDASVGARSDWVLPAAVGLLVGGALLLALGIVMVIVGSTGLNRPPVAASPPPPGETGVAASPPAALAAAGSVAADELERHAHVYPLRLDASLDEPLRRWLWLVKWLLAVPHYVVLVFLWIAFAVVTVIAFFAILFTGRYPRGLFDFNVGVLRWTWRVGYYSYSALGTDRYPPFALHDDDGYPARLDVEYPEHLSRGLVLVKWWLLAIPHYLIVAVFGGGVWWSAGWWGRGHGGGLGWIGGPGGGLIGILVLIAAVWLLFTGRYPRDIFRLVIGLNRWVYRVLAYVTLMRDEYPPFHLDTGGKDPATSSNPDTANDAAGGGPHVDP
jgi:hypothetical protein